MDIKNYISSGILEDYALGLLPAAEMRAVERKANEFPQIKAALTDIENSLEQYAQSEAVTPPSQLKGKILQRIEHLTTTQQVVNRSTPTGNNYIPWLLGGLLALAMFYSFYLFSQNADLKEEVIAANERTQQTEQVCDSVRTQIAILEQRLAILRDPDNQTIIMNGTETHPEAVAAVYWNKEEQQNYLDVINLPKPPSDKQYQLWAIVDGKPVDMGVFDTTLETGVFVERPFIETPQAFAITLEDAGGKPQPNLEQLYVIGNVG